MWLASTGATRNTGVAVRQGWEVLTSTVFWHRGHFITPAPPARRVRSGTRNELFQKARDRNDGDFYRYALAAVIWHEMAHIDGADERAAQLAEETLWQGFIRERRVEINAAMRYAVDMAARRKEAR